MQTTTIGLECDVVFTDEAELEVYLYVGDNDALSVFKFNLNDILKENVDMFAIPTEPPYIRHDDTNARAALYALARKLKAGAEYVEELQNKYLDNEPEPSNKDTVE
jgi:hypothetical protein